jgi:hypothetical protein
MGYPDAAWERAMTVQAVLLKAVSGEIHWFKAASGLVRPLPGPHAAVRDEGRCQRHPSLFSS